VAKHLTPIAIWCSFQLGLVVAYAESLGGNMRQIATVLVTFACVVGCNRDKPAEQPLTPASGTTDAAERTSESIASARCDRAQRCNQIGPAQRYSDRGHCMNVMRADARQMLGQCPRGVDEPDVRECLTEISNQDCRSVVDDLEERIACRSDDLCLN
jgi:Family of unknown function (DUF6184)